MNTATSCRMWRAASAAASFPAARCPSPTVTGAPSSCCGSGRTAISRRDVDVNGETIRAIVDTGATSTVLTAADAERAGFDPSALIFNIPVSTANGTANAARVVADEVAVGGIVAQERAAAGRRSRPARAEPARHELHRHAVGFRRARRPAGSQGLAKSSRLLRVRRRTPPRQKPAEAPRPGAGFCGVHRQDLPVAARAGQAVEQADHVARDVRQPPARRDVALGIGAHRFEQRLRVERPARPRHRRPHRPRRECRACGRRRGRASRRRHGQDARAPRRASGCRH